MLALTLIVSVGLGLWSQLHLHDVGERPISSSVVVLYGLALIGFALAALRFRKWQPQETTFPRLDAYPSPRLEIVFFLIALSTGVFFRLQQLDIIPDGLNHDAAWNGIYAIEILRGKAYAPYTAEAVGHETLYKYLVALMIEQIGVNRMAIVWAATICGIATIPVFYLFVRNLSNRYVALVSLFLFSVSGWHWMFSRTGWRLILTPLFHCLALAALWYGIKSRKTWPFVLAGVGVAGCLNSYNAARIIPLSLAFFLLYCILTQGRDFLRVYYRGLLAGAASALFFSAPMLWYAANHWGVWMGRAEALWIGSSPGRFLSNLRDALLIFNYRGNGDDFIIDTPILEPIPAVLFALGLVYCLLHIRRLECFFLCSSFLLALLPGIVSKPNANRCIATLPFVYVFAAVALVVIVRMLLVVVGPRFKTAVLLLAGLTLLSCAELTYVEYLGPKRRPIWGYYPETLVVARHLKTLIPQTEVHIAAGNYPRDTMTFISYPGGVPAVPYYQWYDRPEDILTVSPRGDRPVAFIVENSPHFQQIRDSLLQMYPDHTLTPLRYPASPSGRVFAQTIRVPAEAGVPVQATDGSTVRSEMFSGTAAQNLFVENGDLPRESLRNPKDLAVCRDELIYLADTANHRIQVFRADGEYVRGWGGFGSAPGRFQEPHAVACDDNGSLYVLDSWNGRVQVFRPDGTFLRQFAPPEAFYGPRGIAVSGARVFVVDSGNSRICVYSTQGTLLHQWGSSGSQPGQFSNPVGVTVDSRGNVYVLDSGNNRLQKFTVEGEPIASWPIPGWSGSALKEAYLDIDDADRIYMTDPVAGNIRVLKNDGTPLKTLPVQPGIRGIAVWGANCLTTVDHKAIRIRR